MSTPPEAREPTPDDATQPESAPDGTAHEVQPPPWAVDRPPRSKGRGAGGVVLAAAMLGLAEALEPDKTEVTIEQRDDRDHNPDTDLDLSFGSLPPLSEN